MAIESPLALITGAAGRLGTVAVRGFLDAGYRVVGVDREARSGGDAPILAMDATDETSVAGVFEGIVIDHGTPSVLIHTVGMWAMAPLAETSLKDWRTMMEVNLTSTFLLFREAARRMADQGGTLIALASRQGSVQGAAQQAAYSASKAGVVRLVEALAAEYADAGLRAHAVAPSMILFGGEAGEAKGVSAEDLVEHFLHLCSPSGASLNGATIHAFG
ncbi:MAG: SDR family NAD(P)-dependent oxidoreductase [Bacteroidetes bacterium]|nr:SDR family NAD(P)-dependent oxidoreductase [Bacteroidota bacterium]MDA0873624.1 SDR family NAD(P)-dependent oxidoreductase [Bacteroidota bacterium]